MLRKSEDFLPPDLLQEWARRLIKANNIHVQISALENDPGYLPEEALDRLVLRLKAAEIEENFQQTCRLSSDKYLPGSQI
jgi:hypothetical protein